MRIWLTDLGDRAEARGLVVVLPSGRQVAPAVTVPVRVVVRVVVRQPPGLPAPVPRPRVRRARVRRRADAPIGTRRLGARPPRITPAAMVRSGVPVASGQLVLAPRLVAGRAAVLVPLVVHAHPAVAGRDGLTVPVRRRQAGARAGATRKVTNARTVRRERVVLAGRVVPGGLAVPVGLAALGGPAGTVGRRMPIVVTGRSVQPAARASSMARLESVVTMAAARRMDAGMRDRRPGPRPAVLRESGRLMGQGRSGPSGRAAMALLLGGRGRVTTPVLRAALARGAPARATIVPATANVAMMQAAIARVLPAKATVRAANARAMATAMTVRAANGRATPAEATARARQDPDPPTVATVRVMRTEVRGRALIARATANVVMAPVRLVPPVQLVPGVRQARAVPQRLAPPRVRVVPRHLAPPQVRVVPRHLAGRTGAVVPMASAVRMPGAARSRDPAGTRRGTAGTRGASPATEAPGSTGRPSAVRPSPIR